jgi:hypothetical protein
VAFSCNAVLGLVDLALILYGESATGGTDQGRRPERLGVPLRVDGFALRTDALAKRGRANLNRSAID